MSSWKPLSVLWQKKVQSLEDDINSINSHVNELKERLDKLEKPKQFEEMSLKMLKTALLDKEEDRRILMKIIERVKEYVHPEIHPLTVADTEKIKDILEGSK